jgi:ABC-2 type transport system permease protein
VREAWALIRAAWLSATSYRLSMAISLGGLLVSIVPLYFVANALQPVMAESIKNEGHQYFGFLLVGTLAFSFIPVAIRSLPGAVGGGLGNGTFEALLGTPTSMPALVAGLTGYGILWTAARAFLMVLAGWLLGAAITWTKLPGALLIVVLIVLAYLPFGLIGAALVLTFRTTGPLTQAVLIGSSLLGGVYYPTHVIPSWLEHLSGIVPLTYGLRALRRVLLDGAPLGAVSGDIGMLVLFTVTLAAAGTLAFDVALSHARRTGTLGQY